MLTDFTHLQIQSEFSIENSIIRIKDLVQTAKEFNLPALAITDTNNIFAAVKFYREAIKQNIKPIIGTTITLEDDSSLILLAMNENGYHNLSKLLTLAYQKENRVFITEDELFTHNQDLIVISSTKSSIANFLLKNQELKAEKSLLKINQVFENRHYLGIIRSLRVDEEKYLHAAVRLGIKTQTPIVALGDVQFIKPEQFEAHEARVCIASGGLVDDENRVRLYSEEQYLKSPQQMIDLYDDIPAAIINTNEIAKRCNLHFKLDEDNYLPQFPTPDNLSITEFFELEVKNGLDKIIKKHKLDKEKYYQRIEFELNTIVGLDFAGYFLIVADFIRWSKENDIPVGPGRGSGAGSLVAYALGITGVDPLKYDLLFERFLNPERVSMPDFDIDFAPHGRDKVIAYVADKYGRKSVSQIITFGTMAAKGVIRDVGRVLGQPYGFSDRLSKLIPNDLDITLDKALNYEDNLRKKAEKDKKEFSKIKANKEQELQESEELKSRYIREEAVASLIDLAKELEGLARNAGTHAGGVIIASGDISDYCPTYKGLGVDDVVVTQFYKKDVESIGLVKFDFLGLSNLSVIQKTIKIIKKYNLCEYEIDIDEINLEDDKVYELYRKGDTTGIFQMESPGMRKHLQNLEPTHLGDIVAMNALYRPGAMENIDKYIDVKHGRDSVDYPHPILEEVLSPTNGVFVYQEQVMRAAQKMAGFSLGGADLLRRAMGYKDPVEMDKQRKNFVDGAFKINQIDADKANEVFDYIDKFSGYGFNKSHSVAYALVSYQTAWLKTHFRSAFISAVISGVMGDSDRVGVMVDEIQNAGIKIIPPSVNLSNYDFSLDEKNLNNIVYGLGAIKGVGEAFIEQIVKNKGDGYKNLFDFCHKIEKKYLNKRAIEALIYSGSFDCFGENKATLLASYESAIKSADIKQKDAQSGQFALFGGDDKSEVEADYIQKPKHNFRQELEFEKSVLGFYFSAHPVDEYLDSLQTLRATFPKNASLRGAKDVRILAMIEHIFYRDTKKGQMATVVLSDGVKKLDIIFFSESLMKFGTLLEVGKVVLVSATVLKNYSDDEKYKDYLRISASNIEEIEIAKNKFAKYLSIALKHEHQQYFVELKNLLLQNKGTTSVVLHYLVEQKTSKIMGSKTLNDNYKINPSSELVDKINILCNDNICKVVF